MTSPTVTVLHADHGITQQQQNFIADHIRAQAPAGFFILQINIPESLGSVQNAMYGPASGDAPVSEQAVRYEARGDREWADRLIAQPSRPCAYVQAIGMPDAEGNFTLFTVYGGPLAPQHPDDPSNATPDASREFWSEHALASE